MNTEIPDEVLGICIAYEQGYGKGVEMSKHPNVYEPFSDTWWAWDYGFSEGSRKAVEVNLTIQKLNEVF